MAVRGNCRNPLLHLLRRLGAQDVAIELDVSLYQFNVNGHLKY